MLQNRNDDCNADICVHPESHMLGRSEPAPSNTGRGFRRRVGSGREIADDPVVGCDWTASSFPDD